MDLRARKRWALVLLLVWMPVWIGLCWWGLSRAYDVWGRPPMLVEAVVYLILGVLWAVPFRSVFRGVGKGEE